MQKLDLKTLSFEKLSQWVADVGWKKYRATQLIKWMYQKDVREFSRMTDIAAPDRVLLEERAVVSALDIGDVRVSSDGTTKFLLTLDDGRTVESVLIPDKDRLALCVSTQVGCTLDCGFCLTGTLGLIRNLKAHEIVEQVLAARRYLDETNGPRVTNIVFMGMGEPLANLRAVLDAVERMISPIGLGFSPRRITLSTAGLVPKIEEFGRSGCKVNLAVSLNATTDEVRDRIMPINKTYPISRLLKACRDYPLPPRRSITFEYVLLKGVNDSDADARRLVQLVRGMRCKINLIPFNDYPGSPFERPEEARVLAFQKIILDGRVAAFIRKSKGTDILAACGQLHEVSNDPTSRLGQVASRGTNRHAS